MSYAQQSDIEDLFGPANVAAWSRFDTGSPTGPTEVDRVATALAQADAQIDAAFLDGPYVLPLAGPVCAVVVTRWAAVLAGVWLYGDRATSSYVDYGGNRYLAMHATVLAEIDRYKSGIRRLDAALRFPPTVVAVAGAIAFRGLKIFAVHGYFDGNAMNIETVPISCLSEDPANVRLHPQRNLDQIAASLRRFGQQKPIVVDANNTVRAGNGTLAAAISLGWSSIQIVRSELVNTEMTAYAIADNRTAELAEWDADALARTLGDPEIGDVGFDDDEIAKLAGTLDTDEPPITLGDEKWMIVITCENEAQQAELLDRFAAEKLPAKALIG